MLVLASYFISTQLSVSVGDVTASIDGIEVSDGNLRMTNPKLEGADKKNGKYRHRRRIRRSGHEGPRSRIKLHAMNAELTTADGAWSRMNADRGLFNNTTERLVMQDKITVITSSGITGELKRASLDMKNQTLRSHQPVWFDMPSGTVKANALTFVSANSTLTFRGKVPRASSSSKRTMTTRRRSRRRPRRRPRLAVPPLPEATGAVSASTLSGRAGRPANEHASLHPRNSVSDGRAGARAARRLPRRP